MLVGRSREWVVVTGGGKIDERDAGSSDGEREVVVTV